MTRRLTAALSVALLLVLAGCGFHLRNALLLPPDLGALQVDARDPDSQLAIDLEQALARAGAEIVPAGTPSHEGAYAVLRILGQHRGNTPNTTDPYRPHAEHPLPYPVP